MPPMLPLAMALHDTGDDSTATVAPELTSQIAPNWTICTRRPTCSVHQSAARIRRSGVAFGVKVLRRLGRLLVTLRDQPSQSTVRANRRRWGHGRPSLSGLSRT